MESEGFTSPLQTPVGTVDFVRLLDRCVGVGVVDGSRTDAGWQCCLLAGFEAGESVVGGAATSLEQTPVGQGLSPRRAMSGARLIVGAVRLQTEDEGNLDDKCGLLLRVMERC